MGEFVLVVVVLSAHLERFSVSHMQDEQIHSLGTHTFLIVTLKTHNGHQKGNLIKNQRAITIKVPNSSI